MDKSFIAAKKNPSFMRSQNYALIQYVLKEDVRNLMQYS